MAYDYEKTKQQYESLNDEQKKQFANMKWWNVQDFLTRYNSEKNQSNNQASTVNTTPVNNTTVTQNKTNNYWVPTEYQASGTNKSNTYQNQWAGNYSYSNQSQYYEKQNTTPEAPKTASSMSSTQKAWDDMSYADQQKKLNEIPWLKEAITKKGWNIKSEEWTPIQTETKWETPNQWWWDYSDNSPERMKQMADNVNWFYQTDPWIFNSEDSYRKFFIDWKGRTPEQEAFLMDLYKNRKIYNDLDNYTADEIWAMDVHGQVPESYLNYLKNSDPERYAAVMDAKAKEQDKIKDKTSLETTNVMTWEWGDTITSNVIEWLKAQWLFVDKDWNLIDDRTENYATDEEKQYAKSAADIIARNLDIDNTVKHTYDDLVEKYGWTASKATLMAMAQDINSDLLREKENNNVELTRLQWYMSYMQQEREDRTSIWQKAIEQLQKQYGMYYTYSPEWMSELAQAQYAATNVTLDQADNWTDTQKQMALDSVLSDYFDKYGSIIQRSKNQVINDVMNYAKQNGVSLSQALEENFLKYLRQKPWYNALATWQSTAKNKYNWSSYEWPDWKKHILRMNETTWQWEELDIWDALWDMADLDWLQSKNRDTRKQALFNLAQQADNPQVQAELIAAAMEWNYAWTCWAYANDINYAITWDKNWIFGNDVKQKEWVCDNTEWGNIKAWDFVVFNYQQIPWVSRNVVPSWLWNTDLETWQDMYDHWHVWYVTWVDAQWNITMTHTKSQIAQTSTFGKNTKLWQALYGSYTPVWWYDKSIPNSIYKAVWDAAEKWDIDKLESLAKQYWYSDYNTLIRQYERQYQDSILPVAEWLLQKIDQLIASTQNTSKLERAATLKWEWSYVNSEAHAAYQSLLNDYALDKLSNMTVKLSPMSDTDVKIVASATTPFMNEWYMYANDNYFRDLQNIRDSIISRSAVLQKKYWDTNAWNWQKQYYDWTTQRFTSTKPRWVLWGN